MKVRVLTWVETMITLDKHATCTTIQNSVNSNVALSVAAQQQIGALIARLLIAEITTKTASGQMCRMNRAYRQTVHPPRMQVYPAQWRAPCDMPG